MIGFLLLFGGIFFGVGLVITIVFLGIELSMPGSGFGAFLALPLFFTLIGLGVIIAALKKIKEKKDVIKKGNRYQAKIYGYVEDTSYTLNGEFTQNLKVHFFDKNMVEREAVIVTNFPKNSNMYGIGMTIDIFEYKGMYGYDKDSIRYEHIPGEEELMDDKPIEPEYQNMSAVKCPNCGASFNAMTGYSNKCPYCNSYFNA